MGRDNRLTINKLRLKMETFLTIQRSAGRTKLVGAVSVSVALVQWKRDGLAKIFAFIT